MRDTLYTISEPSKLKVAQFKTELRYERTEILYKHPTLPYIYLLLHMFEGEGNAF